MSIDQEYKTALAEARHYRETTGATAMRRLLLAQAERMKEDAVGKPADEVAQLHGGVLAIRRTLADLDADPIEVSQPDGGYAT